MKLIIAILLTALTAFVSSIFLPWWSIALAAFLVALIVQLKPFPAWLGGFAGIFLLWVLTAWWIDLRNQHILSQKIANLLPLGGSGFLLILITGFIGGLVAGFAALTAAYLNRERNQAKTPQI